ncbi:heme ABC transporter permease CcmC [Comamonas terrigena]|uniref:heme ABC transporter permease CcmC n=1 Tax=Comamonas terrigena TaxID=32013 RepID=UPI002447F0D7|nr:heme ABC transporter permease CcmC [Comamonas terrigena]MDH0050441.1 heme ABC transporter permease CcmC [Comamonas terrigena]MDH0512897.1 heme ABC transporter permease CcmC [Comamonas terrigena]MDH1092226.1 heme ABC transporter permease CcmC [Comamonas terrigena]MDH1501135.1 heme ABC transporter permease CcmC [Comamonas terrigena]
MKTLNPVSSQTVATSARTAPRRWRQLASPPVFYHWAGRVWPWMAVLAVVLAVAGLWLGFVVAPTDHQQGEVYRIIFLHVPAAWMSMFIYLVAALHAALGLVYGTRLSPLLARALAPTGAVFTVIALWTGAAWGKPTWGAWWVWDARLTSELILLFLYLGYLGVVSAIEDPRRADSAGAIVLLAGVVNVPIIYFSVQWWSTLHQGATIRMDAAPSMTHTMLAGMLLMALACWAYTLAMALVRTRCLMVERAGEEQL